MYLPDAIISEVFCQKHVTRQQAFNQCRLIVRLSTHATHLPSVAKQLHHVTLRHRQLSVLCRDVIRHNFSVQDIAICLNTKATKSHSNADSQVGQKPHQNYWTMPD